MQPSSFFSKSSLFSVDDNGRWSLLVLIVLCTIAGILLAVITSTWQVAVETGQVLIGQVSYDPSSILAAYHRAMFSMASDIAALLLLATGSAWISSVILCAIIEAFLLSGLALIAYSVIGRVHGSFLVAIALASMNYLGTGPSYPIMFLGTEHSYGVLGLASAIFVIGCFLCDLPRLGFFVSGVSFWAHPAWGVWINCCVLGGVLSGLKQYRVTFVRSNIKAYLLGFAFSLAALSSHKLLLPVSIPEAIVSDDLSDFLFQSYIRYWDYHRQKFTDIRLLGSTVVFCFVTGWLLLLATSVKTMSPYHKIATRSVLLSIPVAAILTFIPSWYDPRFFPAWFITLMPGRFINLPIALCLPLLLSYTFVYFSQRNRICSESKAWRRVLPVTAIAFPVGAMLAPHIGKIIVSIYALAMGGLLYAHRYGFIQESKTSATQVPNNAISMTWVSTLSIFAALLAITLFMPPVKERFSDRPIAQHSPSGILTTMEYPMLQIQTGLPVITPHLDGYPYLGQSSLGYLDRFMTDLYGISLSVRPRADLTLHQSIIATKDFSTLWSARSCADWIKVARLYSFGMIVVPASVVLNLQLASTDGEMAQYLIQCPND